MHSVSPCPLRMFGCREKVSPVKLGHTRCKVQTIPDNQLGGTAGRASTMKRKQHNVCWGLVLYIFLLNQFLQTRAEVITLTSDTFSDKIKEQGTVWFVKFCVPWCKHCKNLGSLWDDFGKMMEGEDEIEVGEVDCGSDKPVCTKVDIHSYPTFKVFYNGEEVAKYNGTKRDIEALRTFVLKEADKAAEKAQADDDTEL